MSLNQLNDDLNDAFETYYRSRNPLIRLPYLAYSGVLLALHRLRARIFGGRRLVNERIVEYPLALRWIRPEGRVLDIGCVSSRLPIQLASLGYAVDGLDVRDYPFQHPNFTMHVGDIFKWSPNGQFDIVLLVSTIEHFGLGGYGDLVKSEADAEAVERIRSWMKPGAQLIVSVPYGLPCVTHLHRIHTRGSLEKLFGAFDWIDAKYFTRRDGHWLSCTEEDAAQADSSTLPVNAVTVLNLQKRS